MRNRGEIGTLMLGVAVAALVLGCVDATRRAALTKRTQPRAIVWPSTGNPAGAKWDARAPIEWAGTVLVMAGLWRLAARRAKRTQPRPEAAREPAASGPSGTASGGAL